jgi:predicted nucleotide-binding protein
MRTQRETHMASRRSPQQPAQANLTVDQMRKGIARLERVIGEIEAFDHTMLTKRWGPEQKALEATIEGALASVFGHDTVEYRRYSRASTLDHGAVIMGFGGGHHDNSHEARKYVGEGKVEAVQTLTSAIKWLRDEISDSPESGSADSTVDPSASQSRRIFVVHGHDDGARETVARFLEKIGFEPIILHEQASRNRTVIEKIEAYHDVGFAVVLLTPDDEGCAKGGQLEPRVRQNVLLELGYFLGRLGRDKVCALKRGDVEIPSDFAGVVWVALDASNGWKLALGQELQAAGHSIDWNKVMG